MYVIACNVSSQLRISIMKHRNILFSKPHLWQKFNATALTARHREGRDLKFIANILAARITTSYDRPHDKEQSVCEMKKTEYFFEYVTSAFYVVTLYQCAQFRFIILWMMKIELFHFSKFRSHNFSEGAKFYIWLLYEPRKTFKTCLDAVCSVSNPAGAHRWGKARIGLISPGEIIGYRTQRWRSWMDSHATRRHEETYRACASPHCTSDVGVLLLYQSFKCAPCPARAIEHTPHRQGQTWKMRQTHNERGFQLRSRKLPHLHVG